MASPSVRHIPSMLRSQYAGLVGVILLISVALTLFSGTHFDRVSGHPVNNFLNPYTLMQITTDASFFAIMAIGATMVIITGGIDLSVGSIYALSGVLTALALRAIPDSPVTPAVALLLPVAIGLGCGLLNGVMITGLKVHPFIITLGTMSVYRGVAFVASHAESILVPDRVTRMVKASLGFSEGVYPIPLLLMLIVTVLGELLLLRTVLGRHIFAVGGNQQAARYCGVRVERTLIGVYVMCGLLAGFSAFLGTAYYGSASCADATGYELLVIASAVVGGASLAGGKGSAVGATLGALLIILIRQSIRSLHFEQNYEQIIIGSAIVIAVVFDRMNAASTARRMAMQSVKADSVREEQP